MREKNLKNSKKVVIILVCAVLLAVLSGGVYLWFQSDPQKSGQDILHDDTQGIPDRSGKTLQAVPGEKVIDFNRAEEDENLQQIIRERKAQFGLDEGVDAIVRTDESLKVGDSIVPMREILEKIRIKQGEVIEEGLDDSFSGKTLEPQDLSGKSENSFGIYVVKPNDNLWNIHFRFLQDYFDNKNIRLSPLADKPDSRGFSSGIGKILKFSEKIVYIYNVRERELDVNLDLIHPESKIVVFHMAEILSLLGRIDLENVSMIRFDGENLWISAEP